MYNRKETLKRRREEAKRSGTCRVCLKKPRVEGLSMCPSCRQKNVERLRKRRVELNAKGLCQECTERPARDEGVICQECLDSRREYKNNYRNEYRQRVWKTFLDGYGAKCTCCGEANPKFLTISHTQNDGAAHRKELRGSSEAVAKWAIKNGFPESLTIECYNCNMGRSRNNGVCPHKGDKQNEPPQEQRSL